MKMRLSLAICQLILAVALAVVSCLLYWNNRHLADSRHLQLIQDTLKSYDEVLETHAKVYWSFYESLHTHRKTIQSLSDLNQALTPLAATMRELADLSILGKKPLGSCRDFADSLLQTSKNINASLQDTDQTLAAFDGEAHQAILNAIDNTRSDIAAVSDELEHQKAVIRQTSLLMLAFGLILSALFLLGGLQAMSPTSR